MVCCLCRKFGWKVNRFLTCCYREAFVLYPIEYYFLNYGYLYKIFTIFATPLYCLCQRWAWGGILRPPFSTQVLSVKSQIDGCWNIFLVIIKWLTWKCHFMVPLKSSCNPSRMWQEGKWCQVRISGGWLLISSQGGGPGRWGRGCSERGLLCAVDEEAE